MPAMDAPAEAFEELGESYRAALEQMVSALSPGARVLYDARLATGDLPLDILVDLDDQGLLNRC